MATAQVGSFRFRSGSHLPSNAPFSECDVSCEGFFAGGRQITGRRNSFAILNKDGTIALSQTPRKQTMTVASVADLFALLRRYELLEPEHLNEVAQILDQFADSK